MPPQVPPNPTPQPELPLTQERVTPPGELLHLGELAIQDEPEIALIPPATPLTEGLFATPENTEATPTQAELLAAAPLFLKEADIKLALRNKEVAQYTTRTGIIFQAENKRLGNGRPNMHPLQYTEEYVTQAMKTAAQTALTNPANDEVAGRRKAQAAKLGVLQGAIQQRLKLYPDGQVPDAMRTEYENQAIALLQAVSFKGPDGLRRTDRELRQLLADKQIIPTS